MRGDDQAQRLRALQACGPLRRGLPRPGTPLDGGACAEVREIRTYGANSITSEYRASLPKADAVRY